MRLGVVSDTHGHVEYARQAVRMLESLEVDLLVHCGDIGSTLIPPLFSAWKTHYVFGNVDFDWELLETSIAASQGVCHRRFGSLELEGRKIAFLHGDDGELLHQTIDEGRFDLVLHGHTHRAEHRREGATIVLNPGALYRATPHSLAVVDLPQLDVVSVPL